MAVISPEGTTGCDRGLYHLGRFIPSGVASDRDAQRSRPDRAAKLNAVTTHDRRCDAKTRRNGVSTTAQVHLRTRGIGLQGGQRPGHMPHPD